MLEIACFTASSALAAAQAGADRVELCANYSAGGVTPSLETLFHVHTQLQQHQPPDQVLAPINIMIRPRAGDFIYSSAEFETMRHDIVRLKPFASGFVFGILDRRGNVDVARCCELLDLADPLPCTFHRAIDEVEDLELAMERIVEVGFKSVLTSGGQKSAVEGAEKVKILQEKFGQRISIVLGGGIRAGNVENLKSRTGVEWVHSAAITGGGEEVDADEVRRLRDVFQNSVA